MKNDLSVVRLRSSDSCVVICVKLTTLILTVTLKPI